MSRTFDTRQSAGQVVSGAAVRERARPLATVGTKPKLGWRSQGPQPWQEQPTARRQQTWPQVLKHTRSHKRFADHSLQKTVCYLRCPALNRALSQVNRLYIIPKHGEHRQASVIWLHSPSTQQTCWDRTGHSDIFFFVSNKNRPNGTKVIPSVRKGGSIGCSGCVPGTKGSKALNAPPKLFLSTLAILYRVHAKRSKGMN